MWLAGRALDGDVWLDLYRFEAQRMTWELVPLDPFTPGTPGWQGGHLYWLVLALPPESGQSRTLGVAYRLYARLGAELVTDGKVHNHGVGGPGLRAQSPVAS